jgi:hypothetical protein
MSISYEESLYLLDGQRRQERRNATKPPAYKISIHENDLKASLSVLLDPIESCVCLDRYLFLVKQFHLNKLDEHKMRYTIVEVVERQ